MRRIRFWINFTFLIVPPFLLILGTVGLMRRVWNYLNSDARLAGIISTEATHALGREVQVRDVKFRFSPWNLLPNRVELSDISIAQYPTLNSVLFAHTDKLVLWYDFGQILFPADSKTPLIKEVEVIGPNVTLSRNAQGQWNFEQIFKPSGAPGRPFANKITFQDATLSYTDLSFPHPAGVLRRPFFQRLKQVAGIVLLRPNKSAAFSLGGKSSSGLLQDFYTAGIASLNPLQIDAQVIANQVDLPAAASRVLPSDRVDVKSGIANVDVSVLYTPGTQASKSAPFFIDPNAFIAHGTLETKNLTLNSSQLDGPLQNIRLKGMFTTDSFSGSISGRYAGVEATVEGQILGLLKQERRGAGNAKTVLATPTIALQGQASQVDVAKAIRVFHLNQRLQSIRQLTPEIRRQIIGTTGQVSGLKFMAAGALNNPAVSLAGHIDHARSFGITAANTDVRAQMNAKIVTAEIRGTVEGGMLAAHARVSTVDPGTFDIEAHARQLDLKALRPLVKREISGRGALDLTMRGRRGETPFISAQAQASEVSVNRQTLRSLYARATTVGHNLIIKQVRVEDPKGMALLTGIMDLRTQQLKINVAADNLDLHTVLAAAIPETPKNSVKTGVQQIPGLSMVDLSTVQGEGFLRGKLEGTLTHPEFAGRASLFDVQSGEAELDRVVVDFSLSKDALVIGKGVIDRYPGQVTVSGSLEDLAGGDPTTKLQVGAKSVDIPDLLRLAGVQSTFQPGRKKGTGEAHPLDKYVILGTISSGQALLEGRLKSLKLSEPVTVQGAGVSINGLPVTNLSATVTLTGGNLGVQAAHADIAGGAISVNGTLNDIANKLEATTDLTVKVSNLDMAQLETAFPPGLLPVNLNGIVNVNAIMRGPLNALHVTADINANKILLTDDKGGSYEVGHIQAEANYTKERLIIDKASIRETELPNSATGELQLRQVIYDPNNKMLSGLAKWDRLRLERLRYLFNQSPFAQSGIGLQIAATLRALSAPISGTITGEAHFSGELENPTVDLTWNTSNVQIEDHSITAFTGSALVNKNELHIPSKTTPENIVRLQSDDIDIEIPKVLAFFTKGGRLAADIRAKKLNLEFLHHFSPALKEVGNASDPVDNSERALRALQYISGNGTADFGVSGTTDSPVVEASINLHDVAYKNPITHAEYLFNRIDVSHLIAKEGSIDTDIIEILKTVTDPKTKEELRFEANAQGNIKFSWTPPFIQPDAEFDVRATVPEQNLKVLSLFKQDLNVTSDGRFALKAHVFNKINDYRLGGSLTFNATRLQIGTATTGLYQTGFRDIQGELDFLNDRIQVRDGFTARTQIFGKNGKPDDPTLTGSPIQLTGSLPLQGNGGEGIRLRADRIVFDEPPLPGAKTGKVRGEMKVDINVTGSAQSTTIGGFVTVTNTTLIPPSDFGSGGGGNIGLPINPKFDLLVRLDKNVRVKNQQLDARIEGSINIKGPLFVEADGSSGQGGNSSNLQPVSPGGNPSLIKSLVSGDNAPPKRIGLNVLGRLNIQEGRLTLPTARFVILPPGGITISYPSLESSLVGIPSLGVDVDLRARTRLFATSLSGIRKSYTVTVNAHGPITGAAVDPVTGNSRMTLDFTTNPNDLAVSQQGLQQRLAGVLGGDAIGQFGRNPGQVLAQQLSNVFTTSIVPSLFDKFGFDEFQIGYDPIQGANLIVSRQIFGPFYVTYNRTLGTVPEMYNLKLSLRFKDRFQLSYEQDQSDQQRTLLEGVWKF